MQGEQLDRCAPVASVWKAELIVNLKAAKAFGLTLPQSLLATAGGDVADWHETDVPNVRW